MEEFDGLSFFEAVSGKSEVEASQLHSVEEFADFIDI